MPDPRFFHNRGPFSLQDIANVTGAVLSPGADPGMLADVAPLQSAEPQHLSFFDNVKYKDLFIRTTAGACFADPRFEGDAPKGLALLLTPSPYKAYALAAQKFYPQDVTAAAISEHAIIHPSAKIGKNCVIGAGAVIGENVQIGDYCRIGSNAVITHAIIGSYVSIYRGACIGQDGFGFAIDPAGFVKVPQLGRVIIGDHVEIGANTTIDRGSGPDTVIGSGTWIDNLVQIGHNVQIGKGCVIVSQVGISGSTVLEDYVMLGGQVGLSGHLRIGKGARVAAQSGVMGNIPPGAEYMGYPARPSKEFLRQIATLNRLIKQSKKDPS